MMSRTRILILLGATTLLASRVEATPLPQTGSGGGARARCSQCSSRDSVRMRREKLLLKLDSLRWEVDNRRLSESERERVSEEMTRTVLALQKSLDESMRASTAVAGQVPVDAIEAQAARMYPVAVAQTGYRSRGYLGVTFDGPSMDMNRPGERIIRFYQYPRIALVEPSSPAERAGIVQGDTLLALNGTDVKDNEISLTKLLVPDTKIVVRVRREGNPKDVKVLVGETPEYYIERGRAIPSRTPTPSAPVEAGPQRVRVVPVPSAPMGHATAPSQAPTVWIFNDGVAGARVETINEGLGRALGTPQGVLVITATPGTPAYRSGLRDGDIIVRASGRSVATVRGLQRIISEADGSDGVRLLIVRENKQKDVTLRWQ
jgi:C-terminal processing protease CtpA/Prc